MFLYQIKNSRRALHRALPAAAWPAALLATLLTTSGCSYISPWFHHGDRVSEPAQPVSAPATGAEEAANAPAQTVTSNLPDQDESAGTATNAVETTTVIPDASAALSPTAPKSYVVQRGDTLWGLARLFLKDPWLWPEIWYANPDVTNPHRIYPGDTLKLATGSDGKPSVQLVRTSGGVGGSIGGATRLEPLLRSTSLEAPIATIPYSAISAFLSRPGILTRDQIKAAPYILALRDRHVIAGADNDVYVRRLRAAEGERYSVFHVGEAIRNPDHGHDLGYLAVYAGVAEVTLAGDPARAQITESAREILAGDILLPEAGGSVADFVPRPPARAVHGRIATVVNGTNLAGQYHIVALNLGAQDGLEPGNVLRVQEVDRSENDDRCARIQGEGTCLHMGAVRLPLESAGTLLVFRVFDHVSFALVAAETSPLSVGDRVVNP